jgi:penicillin-binding protein-related factor A (putative recombinase)
MGGVVSLANRGRDLEARLDVQHEAYALTGRAFVLRTPPNMRILRATGKGQFVACFAGEGPPDYIALHDCRTTIFDAKSHEGDRFPFAALPEHQARAFDSARKHGARAGLVVHMADLNATYWVCWATFGPMWWAWSRTPGRAKAGTASLSVEQLDEVGVRLKGVEWLSALSP